MSKKDFSAKVKQQEKEDAGGICRICGQEPITQYHHITEKGMGGGRGTGLQINCLGVGACHNHDNPDFLRKADEILRQRVDKLFPGRMDGAYTESEIALRLDDKNEEIVSHAMNKHLKNRWHTSGRISTKEEILRWLEGR